MTSIGIRRTLKTLGIIAAAPAVLALLALALLQVRPARLLLLRAAVSKADGALPGRLTAERRDWPSAGTVILEGVSWIDGADTLFSAGGITVSVRLAELRARDIHAREISVTGMHLDLPAIAGRFPAPPGEADRRAQSGGEGPGLFPRAGSFPPIPSVAADRIFVEARAVRLADGFELRGVRLEMAADLRAGEPPRVELRELSIGSAGEVLSVDSLHLSADLSGPSAEGGGTVAFPWGTGGVLRCGLDPDGSFEAVLSRSGTRPPGSAGIAVSGRAAFAGRRVESVDLEAVFLTPGAEELGRLPRLSGALGMIGRLEGVSGAAAGRIALSPSFSARYSLDLARNSWIDTLHLAGAHEGATTRVDTLILAVPGLAAGASGSLDADAAEAVATLRSDDAARLAPILPGLALPGGTAVRLRARARLDRRSKTAEISVRGRAAAGGVPVDTLEIRGTIPAGRGRPVVADLLVGALGIEIAARATADLSSGIDLTLSRPPLRLPDSAAVLIDGRIRAPGGARQLRVEGLRLEGAIGRLTIDARIDGAGGGRLDLLGEWPSLPPRLATAIGASPPETDSIRSRWERDGPFRLEARADIERTGEGRRMAVRGEALLPGPRVFAPLIGPGGELDDLGPVAALFRATYAGGGDGGAFTAVADLSRTAWLDTMIASIGGRAGSLSIDSALVCFEGLRLSASGSAMGDSLDIAAAFSLADSQLVRRLGRLAGKELSLAGEGRLAAGGRSGDPRISADLQGRFSTPGIEIPSFTATARLEGGSLSAGISALDGLDAGPARFDSVRAWYRGPAGGDPGEGAARIEGTGADTRLLLALRLPRGGDPVLLADTLHLRLSERTLSTRRPFAVAAPRGGGLRIEGMRMDGTIGRIEAHGAIAPDSSDLEAHIAIVLPEKHAALAVADRLWPDSVTIDARAGEASRLTADGRISGIVLGEGTEVDVSFGLESTRDASAAWLTVAAPLKTLLSARASLPPVTASGSLPDGPIALDLLIDDWPVPRSPKALLEESPGEIGLLSGVLSARGTLSEPEAAVDLSCRFLGGEAIETYMLVVRGHLSGAGLRDTTLARLAGGSLRAAGAAAEGGASPGGLHADLILSRSGGTVLSGSLLYPLDLSLKPMTLVGPAERGMSLELRSTELSLTDLDPLLPPDVDLEGFCTVDLSARGPAQTPDLAGSLKTRDMSISVAKNLTASPTVDLSLGGTLQRPSVEGTIVIERGQLRIPEFKESLLPAEGNAVLREAADSLFAEADSVPRPPRDGDGQNAPASMKNLELDVAVSIPSTFRIQSEKLNLELEGNLRIVQRDGRPVVTGELKPQQGRLLFMGRFFQIQRGSVFFYGEDELNPSFDLTLTATVSDTGIRIDLTGTAIKPDIKLTSDPQMSESDIMSLLLFGRPMNDLDGAQSSLLQQRTAEALMAYGAAKIEGEMSQRLGVDLFTFQQSTRDPDQSALMVGKYLNERTMLKYEQGLESAAGFLINLEYYVTRRLKIETFIDEKSETGLEINWSKEY